MKLAFAEVCQGLKRPHAEACFRRAMRLNVLAHGSGVTGSQECFKMKARAVSQVIRLAPQALYVDDFQLTGGGVVGITWPGHGRMHVMLRDLEEDSRRWLWDQICRQCIGPTDLRAG